MFITLEGGEGAGKTTLIEGLRKQLVADHHEVVVTREPGGTALGERIREWLLHGRDDLSPYAELQLFLAVRAQHLHEVIHPALNRGAIVLCDRYNDSSIAYQGYARGLDPEAVATQCELACGGKKADLTLYLDLPPAEGLDRLGEARDRIEGAGLDFHHRVRSGFLALAKAEPERVRQLDARQPKEALLALALREITDKVAWQTSK